MRAVAPRLRRAAGALLAGLVLLLAGAAPASAHAVLTGSTPARGAVVAEAPSRVVLTFTEEIALGRDALRVLDGTGRRVDDARPVARGGNAYAVGLRRDLPHGTYTVAYQVVSADSHPVAGAFTFSVGAPSAVTGAVPDVRDPDAGPVGRAYAAGRFGSYAGMLLLTGTVCFALLCVPRTRAYGTNAGAGPGAASDAEAGTGRDTEAGAGTARLLRRFLVAGWAVLVVSSLALLTLRGSYTGSGRAGEIADLSRLGEVLRTRPGALLGARLGLLAAGAVLWAALPGPVRGAVLGTGAPGTARGTRRVTLGAALVLGAALASTWSLAEHASVGPQTGVAVPADMAHMLAAGAWIGGLCVLAAALRGKQARQDGEGLSAWAVARFSRVAVVSVCVLAVTGLYQSWRQVGSLPALTGTRFGVLLLVKGAGVGLLLCLGYVSHRQVRRLRRGEDRTRGLRRRVAAEAVLGLGVLVVTTALTTTEPARSGGAAAVAADDVVVSVAAPFDTGGPKGEGTADVVVDPGRAGPNGVHLTLTDPAGRLLDVPEVRATLTSSTGVGPLTVPLRRVSEGHWTVPGFQIPAPGTWQLALTVRTSDVDQVTVRRRVGVR